MRWTQCPTSASCCGMLFDFKPRLIGRQLAPASSLRNAPAAEIAVNMRFGSLRVEDDRVQAHAARARLPGAGRRVRRAGRRALPTFSPPSVERKSAASSTPA